MNALMQANFCRYSTGKICENSACGRPQAVEAGRKEGEI